MTANSNPSASPNPSPSTDPDPNPDPEPDQVLLRRLHRLCRHARVRKVHAGLRLVAITARGLPHFHRVATPQEVPGPLRVVIKSLHRVGPQTVHLPCFTYSCLLIY